MPESLLLRMLSDMSFRMKNIDQKLLSIQAQLDSRPTEPSSNDVAANAHNADGDDDFESPASHVNNIHIALKK